MTETTAATPGDDRGRELAERALNLAESILNHGVDPGLTDGVVRDMRREIEGQRQDLALAAPAETEAGDGHVWSPDSADEERAEWQCRWCSSRLHGDLRCVHAPASPPAPEGEAGSGLHARVTPGQKVTVGATGADGVFANARMIVLPGGRDVAVLLDGSWPAPAGPAQAEGAGETAVLRRQLEEAHRKIAALHAVAYPDQSGRANGAPSGAGDDAAGGGDRS